MKANLILLQGLNMIRNVVEGTPIKHTNYKEKGKRDKGKYSKFRFGFEKGQDNAVPDSGRTATS